MTILSFLCGHKFPSSSNVCSLAVQMESSGWDTQRPHLWSQAASPLGSIDPWVPTACILSSNFIHTCLIRFHPLYPGCLLSFPKPWIPFFMSSSWEGSVSPLKGSGNCYQSPGANFCCKLYFSDQYFFSVLLVSERMSHPNVW